MNDTDTYTQQVMTVFENMTRQGPGSPGTTLRALNAIPAGAQIENILEIGCGKGESALVLAENCAAHITAVDNHQPFLDHLCGEAARRGLGDRISTHNASMFDLDFSDGWFDLLWAEGCAFIMGFEQALANWRRLLRQDGFMFISDAVWTVDQQSPECRAWWAAEYPGMASIAERRCQAEQSGYAIAADFILPADDWKSFYDRIACQLKVVQQQYGSSRAVDDLLREIGMYERYGTEYSYLCLLLRKK